MSLALEALSSIALLSEYTHTLDALPIDLSRNFADLRELDAVLSSTVLAITAKIENLTNMIELGTASKEDKLWLLTEIAEEASRLKLGGEDKIRVACQAADNLKAHWSHLRNLGELLPTFDTSILDRKTVYPHVSEKSYMPTVAVDTGRRRRGAAGQLLNGHNGAGSSGVDPSPIKRKRVRDEDPDVGTSRSPKKPTASESNARARQNGRGRKVERGASPSESILSVTSHIPHSASASVGGPGRAANSSSRATGAGTGTTKRARANNTNSASARNPTPLAHEAYPPHDVHGPSTTSTSRRGAGTAATNGNDDIYNVPPATGHPSLPHPYQNGTAAVNGAAHGQTGPGLDIHGASRGGAGGGSGGGQDVASAQDWNIPPRQQLAGPGIPVARSNSHRSAPTTAVAAVPSPGIEPDDGVDGEVDPEDRVYCFCNNTSSYGDMMIGCDGPDCEREWFHLTCVGLPAPPTGDWYCKVCEPKQRNAKRTGRGGKRKAGGGRGNARG